mgnify:CR=1 FL=1
MKFNGFRSVSEYETECARLGCHTERVPFHSGDERFFVLVVRIIQETFGKRGKNSYAEVLTFRDANIFAQNPISLFFPILL